MGDFSQLVRACLASGAVLTALCAMIVVPVVLWIGVRLLTPRIVALDGDPRWQAPLAALAAALPGAAFGALAFEAILTAPHSQCLAFVSGRIIFGVVIALAVAAFVRAAWLSWRRHAEVRKLIATSRPPSARVAAIASDIGLSVRSLAGSGAICALGGTMFVSILLSQGAERRLNDDELRAALLHERAHYDRGDQWLIALVTFASEALPLFVGDLIALYLRARELAADRDATRKADGLDLASAILRLSGAASPTYVAGLSGEVGAVETRLDALLTPRPTPLAQSRLVAVLSLALLGALATTSLIANLVVAASCAHMGSML
jgi:Zn-dependent protease with chaperone function